MKVLIRNVDNVVVYAQPDLDLTDEGLFGDGWYDPKFSTLNARIEEAELPEHWAGSVWSFAGGQWSVFDIAQHAKIVQAAMPTLEDYDKALTDHIDATAKARRWADRVSLMSRAGFAGRWQAEAIAFGTWADGCNVVGYQMLADFQAGNIPQPTIAEMIAALPSMVWPT